MKKMTSRNSVEMQQNSDIIDDLVSGRNVKKEYESPNKSAVTSKLNSLEQTKQQSPRFFDKPLAQ